MMISGHAPNGSTNLFSSASNNANSLSKSLHNSSTNISTTQSESLLSLLTHYDPKNLSASDARDIVSGIREIGVKAGQGLRNTLEQTGFKPVELAQKAGVMDGGQLSKSTNPQDGARFQSFQGGSLKSESIAVNETLDSLTRLVDKYKGSDLSDDDWSSLYQDLSSEGIDVTRPLIDILL